MPKGSDFGQAAKSASGVLRMKQDHRQFHFGNVVPLPMQLLHSSYAFAVGCLREGIWDHPTEPKASAFGSRRRGFAYGGMYFGWSFL